MLPDKVIGIYCLIDDILKGLGHSEPQQRKVSDSEVITTAVVSALYFKGNQSTTLAYVRSHSLMPQMIHKSGLRANGCTGWLPWCCGCSCIWAAGSSTYAVRPSTS